ncbi:MAG: hypothetical protein ACT4O1_09005 [Gemmatimonadota bacterium]
MRRAASLILLTLSLAACASTRGVRIESGDETSYRISVRNARSSTVAISYQSGSETRELGTLKAGESLPFVVISSTPTITVHARSISGAAINSYTVSLTSGSISTVTIR